MLTYIEGDLFSSPAQVLVNTVNTVGVMGKGIALEFKKRYPDMFEEYKSMCDKHNLVIGKLMLWYAADHWILQFPTKEHWRNPSKLEYIEKGLMAFVRKYADYNISSIAFPKLGCGNGELDWKDVKVLMEKYLKDLPIDVYIYLGPGENKKPEHKKQTEMSEWMKENAKDISFSGIKDDISFHSTIIPIQFEMDGVEWNAYWKAEGKLTFETNGNKKELDEDDVQKVWDSICVKRVFSTEKDLNHNLFFYLLMTMGYLQPIMICEEDVKEMKQGYQLELGKGRVFLVRGK